MSNQNAESARQALVAMLRQCAEYLSNLSAGDVDALMNGEIELRLSVATKKTKLKTKHAVPALEAREINDIVTRLRSMENRAEGERLLRDVAAKRSALERIARYLDVAVRREDRQQDLLHRIIESTIGFRLGAAAIQGRPVQRDPNDGENSSPTQIKK
jgi:hypothetical protein